MPTQQLTPEIIAAAIQGFEVQKQHIDSKIAELRTMLPGGPSENAATPEAPTRKRKKFSAAARRKMAQSQKLRWARIRGEAEPATPEPPKRRISEEGMKRIMAATKKRWRLAKAAKAQQEKAAAKKTATKKATVKKAAVKTATAKKMAPAAAQAATEAAAQ